MNVSALCPGKLAFKACSLNLPDPNIYSHVYARICLVHWLELSKRKLTFGCNHAFIDRNVFSLHFRVREEITDRILQSIEILIVGL